tara:strand:+ start:245 stop:616 length:372 start_codon:yes stop_codon:yes gene_type:complete
MAFRTYTVGRSSKADIRVEHDSVSRAHLEATITTKNKIYCVDCNSTHGSFLRKNNEWTPFTQGYVAIDEELRLGKKSIKVRRLMQAIDQGYDAKSSLPLPSFEPLSIKPRRDSSTGEVMQKIN